ncbi:dienelactone hydrolase [Ciceribacter sp. RN22]|uniref:alpha/beta hydrolase family protein n=1 Tax=Ciceribacter sp. RN22 TaxID=2954932 RepID=UPI002093F6B9|nr:dienelactone hydrolase [Ciceribacter sp. RN22]MCO6178936.1 dienelactone hydrolase [Ciceribacter sp. RN22]
MLIKKFVVFLASFCFAVGAHAAGLKVFEVPADDDGPALKAVQWSPCAQPSQRIELGPFVLDAVRDCPLAGNKLPLIVISHGFGGTGLSHHDTAEALADAGFMVVALNHPDDNAITLASNRSNTLAAFVNRPQDIKRLVDYMLAFSADSTAIDAQRIGFYGFSRGGYTGLVLGGANPDFRELRLPCQDRTGMTCERVAPQLVPAGPWVHDPRIKAFVIADPLSDVFPGKENIQAVRMPIQLWGSQNGGDGVLPAAVDALARNLPEMPDFHVVPDAGHFAFLTTCPPAMAKSAPEICADGPDFDRAAFHQAFNTQVLTFFRQQLVEGILP